MQKEFVTYKTALKLKKIGFNKKCFAEYNDSEFLLIHYPNNCHSGYCDIKEYEGVIFEESELILAPLWQQASDWLMEKYKIQIEIIPYYFNSQHAGYCYDVYIEKPCSFNGRSVNISLPFKSCEEARERAFLKAIELIK